MRDISGHLWSVQTIDDNGKKLFLTGGRKKECFHALGNIQLNSLIYLCEGYSTGATIHEATENPVIICFDAGNLEAVAIAIKAKYPTANIIICADNDQFSDVNTGIIKATQAANAIGAKIAIPQFTNLEKKPSDFNDLHV